MRRTELNLFVPFFLGTAATRLRMQLSRSPVSLLQAAACTDVGSPGRKFFFFPGWFPSCCRQDFQGLSPGGKTLERPPRPRVKSLPFKKRWAAECRYPGPCGHTLENHRSPAHLCFHCSDLWETCKTQPCGEGVWASWEGPPTYKARLVCQSPFWNPSAFGKPS